MQKYRIAIFTRSLIIATCLGVPSLQAGARQEGQTSDTLSTPAAGTTTPAVDGRGPGTGRNYQGQTPGLGREGPDYRGRDAAAPAYAPYSDEMAPPKQRYGRPGFGRSGRGYGAGFPGYRGQGGSGYPQHRQYGNPPRYPVTIAPGEQPAPWQ